LRPRTAILGAIIIFLLSVTVYITPWETVILLARNVSQYAPFSEQVHFPSSDGTTISFTVNGSIRLSAMGAISEDNPIKAEAYIANSPLENLTIFTNTTEISIGFGGSLEFPLKENPGENWYRGGYIFINVTSFPWNGYGSTRIVYFSHGQFDLIVRFLNSRFWLPGYAIILQEITVKNLIAIGPQQETFAYVTSVAFVCLDLIIIALMALEILLNSKDPRTNDREHGRESYPETEPPKILCY
jgi:hypothetical protein